MNSLKEANHFSQYHLNYADKFSVSEYVFEITEIRRTNQGTTFERGS